MQSRRPSSPMLSFRVWSRGGIPSLALNAKRHPRLWGNRERVGLPPSSSPTLTHSSPSPKTRAWWARRLSFKFLAHSHPLLTLAPNTSLGVVKFFHFHSSRDQNPRACFSPLLPSRHLSPLLLVHRPQPHKFSSRVFLGKIEKELLVCLHIY
jgi:hypothetical protein